MPDSIPERGVPEDPPLLFSPLKVRIAGSIFLAGFLARYGFRISGDIWTPLFRGINVIVAVFLCVDLLGGLARAPDRKRALIRHRADFILLLVLSVAAVLLHNLGTKEDMAGAMEFTATRSPGELNLGLLQLGIVGMLVLRVLRAQGEWLGRGVRAELLLIGSFALLVAVGTLLLLLPGAHAQGAAPLTFVEAFFTSTSASCVTGLVLRDTGAELSHLGQFIVMVLFQIGGLGIITFVGFGAVISSRRFSLPEVITLREVFGARSNSDAWRSVSHVVLWALVAEVVGCIALYLFLPESYGNSVERWFWSLFHSISAFCNAGFSLQADSLEGLRGNVGINLVVMALILLGGFGMPVARELLGFRMTRGPFFRRFAYFRRLHDGQTFRALSLQTRLSLWMTGGLLLVGMLGFWALESGSLLAGSGAGESALMAAFQSVTTRTAGFNSVPMGEMQEGTKTLFLALMAIGAGPVSTGGGIKTVTFAVLLVTVRAMATGRKNIEVAGRSIPRLIVRTAISVTLLYTGLVGLTVFVLAVTDPQVAFGDRSFEAVSALSTVGLSTGVTTQFSTAGQFVLCLAMFAGRVGPLALTLSVFRSGRKAAPYEFPEEDLIVG